jgi:DNA-directed RNA polymerase subunit M/transcription elongation factor TFIIS
VKSVADSFCHQDILAGVPVKLFRKNQSIYHQILRETYFMAVGAKIAKTADRKKVMDTTKSTDCPKCGKPTRIVKRVKDRERNVPGGIYISCSGCEFFEKL